MKLEGRKELCWKLTRHLLSVGVRFSALLFQSHRRYLVSYSKTLLNLMMRAETLISGQKMSVSYWTCMPQISFTVSFAERVKRILALSREKKGVALDPFSLM